MLTHMHTPMYTHTLTTDHTAHRPQYCHARQGRRGRTMLLSWALFAGFSLVTASSAQAETETQRVSLETPAQPGSLAPRLTLGSDGEAWLSWLERVTDGATGARDKTSYALKISAFRNNQFAAAVEVARGDNWVANWADTPHLFVGAQGWLVAQWLQKSGKQTYAYDVMLSQSKDGGKSWSTPFPAHDDATASEHGFASFFPWPGAAGDPTASGTAGVGLAWLDGRQTVNEGPMTLRTATLAADGRWLEQQALDLQVCDCCQTGASPTNLGPVVVYRDRTDQEIRDIQLVKWQQGQWQAPIRVHQDDWQIAGCPVNGPQVASLGDEVAVLWYSMRDDAGEVKLARSRDQISHFAPPYVIARDTPLGRVSLAGHPPHLAAAWIEEYPHQNELQLAWFRSDENTPSGFSETQRLVLTQVPAGRASGFPSVVLLAPSAQFGTSALVAWTAKQGEQLQVRVTRISAPPDTTNTVP